MTDERWLREGLADAVPEAPQAPGRAQAARERASRARRRTATAVLAGTAAVVAIGVVGAIAFQRDPGSTGPAGPTASDTSPYDAPACPPAPRPIPGHKDPLDRPDPDLPDAVPEGASSVRLCQGDGTTFDVPQDALVNDVGALVDEINGLRKTGAPDICTEELGPGYRLVFGYDDGSTFVVSGKLYGCRELVVGSGYRSDATVPWQAFAKLLRGQRTTAQPVEGADTGVDLSCAFSPSSPVALPADITRARFCVVDRGVQIPADDLAFLVQDMSRHTGPPSGLHCLSVGPLVAATRWGDRVALIPGCHQYLLHDDVWWTPSQEAQEILNTLVARVRAAPNTE